MTPSKSVRFQEKGQYTLIKGREHSGLPRPFNRWRSFCCGLIRNTGHGILHGTNKNGATKNTRQTEYICVSVLTEKRGVMKLAMETYQTKRLPIGRKIARLREVMGIKQDSLADKLGVSQQAVSRLEKSENVDEGTLDRVAIALGVSKDTIKNFNEDAVINYITNNFNGEHSHAGAGSFGSRNENCSFNPIDKIVELYERLLVLERERADKVEPGEK